MSIDQFENLEWHVYKEAKEMQDTHDKEYL